MDAKRESDGYREFDWESGRTGTVNEEAGRSCFDHVAGELENKKENGTDILIIREKTSGIGRIFVLFMCLLSLFAYSFLGYREVTELKERGGINWILQQMMLFDADLLYTEMSDQKTDMHSLTVMGLRARLDRGFEDDPPADKLSDESNKEVSTTEERYPIIAADLSTDADRGLALINETSYAPDLAVLAEQPLASPTVREIYEQYGEDAPAVLILHTHGTETYMESEADFYSPTDGFHTTDPAKNMIAVGEVMAKILNGRGINTLHCTVLHDEKSYRDSYARAAETIEDYLEKYPSISYIFDVHRDAVIGADMTQIRPVCEMNGETYAQFMCVVGTDAKGANHPDWEDNLILAARLQCAVSGVEKSLARAINLRGAAFNESYTSGSLLLEIGSCGNTLAEAKRCAAITAECIADVIYG